jgi:ATP synthase protein I
MSERDGEPARKTPEDRSLSERLQNLERRLDAERREADVAGARETPRAPRQGYGLALRLGADFVAGVVVGAAVGWGIDRIFGIAPWGMIVFLLLGFAAGVLSVLRSAGLVKPGPADLNDPGNKV